ncbi:unnamed protein product [Lymnaea stagnalis]|uniref:PDZ domain-containing protein n=1 Tax=Lymnaea stagnalis TaxID=6523 RepID=A0AAV2I4T4_LYMST
MNKSTTDEVSECDLPDCELVALGDDNNEYNFQKRGSKISVQYLSKVTDEDDYFWKPLEQLKTTSDANLYTNAVFSTAIFTNPDSRGSSNPFLTDDRRLDTNPFRCVAYANSNPFREVSMNSFSTTQSVHKQVGLHLASEKTLVHEETSGPSANPFENCGEFEFDVDSRAKSCDLHDESGNLQDECDPDNANVQLNRFCFLIQKIELYVNEKNDGSWLIKRVMVKTVTPKKPAASIYDTSNTILAGDEVIKIDGCYLNQLTYTQCETLLKSISDNTVVTIKRHNLTWDSNEHAESTLNITLPPFTQVLVTKDNTDYCNQSLGDNVLNTTHSQNSYLLENIQLFPWDDVKKEDVPRGFNKLTIVILKNADENLGVSIVPSYGDTRDLYQIKRLLPDGACAKSGHIEIGDRLLTCNGFHLKNLTQVQCLDVLRHSSQRLELTVLRQKENKDQSLHPEADHSENSEFSIHNESEIESKGTYCDISKKDQSLCSDNSLIFIKEICSECNTSSFSLSAPIVCIEKDSVTTSDSTLERKDHYNNDDNDSMDSLYSLNYVHKIRTEDFPCTFSNKKTEITLEINVNNDCTLSENTSKKLADSFLHKNEEEITEQTKSRLFSTFSSLNSSVSEDEHSSANNSPSGNECLKTIALIETSKLYENSVSLSTKNSSDLTNTETKSDHFAKPQYTNIPLNVGQESTDKLLVPFVSSNMSLESDVVKVDEIEVSNLLEMECFPPNQTTKNGLSPPDSNNEKSIATLPDLGASINAVEFDNQCKEIIYTHAIVETIGLSQNSSSVTMNEQEASSERKDVSMPAQIILPVTSASTHNLIQIEKEELLSKSNKTNESYANENIYFTTLGVNTMGQEKEVPICPMTAIRDSKGNSLCIPSPAKERATLKQSRAMDTIDKEDIAIIMAGFNVPKPQIKDETSNVAHRLIDEDEIVPTILTHNQKEMLSHILNKWGNDDGHPSIFERALGGFAKPIKCKPVRREDDHVSILNQTVTEISLSKTQDEETGAFLDSNSVNSNSSITEQGSEAIYDESHEPPTDVQIRFKSRKDIKYADQTNYTEKSSRIMEKLDNTGQENKILPFSGFKARLENFPEALDPIASKSTTRRPKSMMEVSSTQSSYPFMSFIHEDNLSPALRPLSAFKAQSSSTTNLNFLPTGRPAIGNFYGATFTPRIKTDYPKTRQDDGRPFQVDVLKGIIGLGIKVNVTSSGYAQVSEIQSGGPVDKNGQIRVNDYIWSINSTELTGQNDAKVQQVLRLLPRGLVKLVVSGTNSKETEENTIKLREQEESPLSISTKSQRYSSNTISSLTKSPTEKNLLDVEPELPLTCSTIEKTLVEYTNNSSNPILDNDSPPDKIYSLSTLSSNTFSSLVDQTSQKIVGLNKDFTSLNEQSASQKVLPIKDESTKPKSITHFPVVHSDDRIDEPDLANLNRVIQEEIFSNPRSMSKLIFNRKKELFQQKLSPALTPKQNPQFGELKNSIYQNTIFSPDTSEQSPIKNEDRITALNSKTPPPVAPKPQSFFLMTVKKSDYSGDFKDGERVMETSHVINPNERSHIFTQSVKTENVNNNSKTTVLSKVRMFDKPSFADGSKNVSFPSRTLESRKTELLSSKMLKITPSLGSTNSKILATSAIRPKDIDISEIHRESSDGKTITVLSPTRLNSALSPRLSSDSPTSIPLQKFGASNNRPHSQSFPAQVQRGNEAAKNASDNVTIGSCQYEINVSPQNFETSSAMINEKNIGSHDTNDKVTYSDVESSMEQCVHIGDYANDSEMDISDSFLTTPLSSLKAIKSDKDQVTFSHNIILNKKPEVLPRKKVENKKESLDESVKDGFFQWDGAETNDSLKYESKCSQISNYASLLDSPNPCNNDFAGEISINLCNKETNNEKNCAGFVHHNCDENNDTNKNCEFGWKNEDFLKKETLEHSMNAYMNNEHHSNLLLGAEIEKIISPEEEEDDIYTKQAKLIVELVITNVFSDQLILSSTVNDLALLSQQISESEAPPLPEAPPPNIKSTEHSDLQNCIEYRNTGMKSDFLNDQNMPKLAIWEQNLEQAMSEDSAEPLSSIQNTYNNGDNVATWLDIPNETSYNPIEDAPSKVTLHNNKLLASNEIELAKNTNDDLSCQGKYTIIKADTEDIATVSNGNANIDQLMSNFQRETQNIDIREEASEQWAPTRPTTAPPVITSTNGVYDNTVVVDETSLAMTDDNALTCQNSFYNDPTQTTAEEIPAYSLDENNLQKGGESCDDASVRQILYVSQIQKREMEANRNENKKNPLVASETEQAAPMPKPRSSEKISSVKPERPNETDAVAIFVHTAIQPETGRRDQEDSYHQKSQNPEIHRVVMVKGATGVGLCLEGGHASPKGNLPIIIKRIFKGGPAEKCGKLKVKDEIIEVNGVDFTSMRHYEAWNHLKFLDDGDINITVRRY